MRIKQLRMKPLQIPFRTTFKHASAERAQTASVWVEANSAEGDLVGYGEGCPRTYVTGETVDGAIAWLDQHREAILAAIADVETLTAWVNNHGSIIDSDPAAWCAVELALLDLFGKESGQSVEQLLALPPLAGSYAYSAVLGDGTTESFQQQLPHYVKAGFRDFKVKLSGELERDIAKVDLLKNQGVPLRIRADANNLWQNAGDVVTHIEAFGNPFWAIEEPLMPRDFDGLEVVAGALGVKIILDESLTRAQDLSCLRQTPGPWVPNLRISKLGGLIRSIKVLREARALRLPVIIGAHVGETSVLTRAGLTLATAAVDGRLAMEGAFGTHLLERDVCEPPLMFAEAGLLRPGDWKLAERAGWGLKA